MENYNNNNNNNNINNQEIVNAENTNIDSTLNEVSRSLKKGETLILDVGNNYYNQTDDIYDALVTKGYSVTKAFRNGRNQIHVRRND